ncbi:MAG: hypothetical protein QW231_02900 [Candidatus Bathyarchaeia archaeon]
MEEMDERRILFVLQKYYLEDVSLERAAEEESVPLLAVIDYMIKNELPFVHEVEDISEGIKKVDKLMERVGMHGVLSLVKTEIEKAS